jgi:tetratricopeptide (TPR) repeat protein/predicted Ser/Thr protein kinase
MALGTIGKYERLDVLGHGASGIVYLARDTLLRRQVAIKEVSAQGEERDRFLDEARVLDRLRHPNIVAVHSVDTINGKIVIDMEYVVGENLLEILRASEGPMPIDRSVDIAAQVCDGLAYAQARHIVHRDIKPANILVSRTGQVKLVDFGLAQVLGTNSFVGGAGTYAYMAPEDFDEDAASDAQSDIWALGVILYEMLTGRRPFSVARPKDPFAWKRAIESQPIEAPNSNRPEVSDALSEICQTALERRRGDRYRTASEFGAALRNVQLFEAQRRAGEVHDDDEAVAPPSHTLLGATDVDTLLSVATDHWEQARSALTSGTLARWLWSIGEAPLAQIAQKACDDSGSQGSDPDALLREFLYQAGLDTAVVARRSASAGSSFLRAGAYEEAADALLTAIRIDPGHPAYFVQLYKALLGSGDHAAALAAISRGLEFHPRDRTLRREQAELNASKATVSQEEIDFGVLRHGDQVRTKVVVRNGAGNAGVMQGRITALPAWISATPMTFVTRHQQPISLVASSSDLWERDQAYEGRIAIETNDGQLQVAVKVGVKSPLRSFQDIFHWYLPLLAAALAPLLIGEIATLQHRMLGVTVPYYTVGLLASGLLFAASWVVCAVAETGPAERLFMALGACFAPLGAWLFWLHHHVHALGPALLVTVIPAGLLFVAQGFFMLRYPQTWGRWPLWGWAVGVIAALLAAAFWNQTQAAVLQ